MERRHWPMILIGIVLIALIYNFLRTIFSSDVKRFSHDRIYIDYNSYSNRPSTSSSNPSQPSHSSYIYQQVELARHSMDSGRMEATVESYEKNMKEVLSQIPPPETLKPLPNPQYEEITALGRRNIDGLSQAKLLFSERKYEEALSQFSDIFQKLPENDILHRYQICDSIAECHFFLKNNDEYVKFKVRFLRYLRQWRGLVHRVYPNLQMGSFNGWASPADASQQLLKIKTFALESLQGEERESVIRRAELDLEVARQAPG